MSRYFAYNMFVSFIIRHDFHNVLNPAIQSGTNPHEYFRGNMPIPSHLGNGSWADARLFTQVFFLHVFIDKQLPEFFITHRHKISPPYRYTKNALPLGRALGLLQPYCQGLFQHLTALFTMIAYLVRESKKMIDPHEFRLRQISFCSVKETVEPLSSQSYNANTS